ncbi:MFS general substrate transporter [Mytilinidion resinicola]|uniref:MFS general substrate transporter n=1 Tax=Mytilinidion resinicola TaxID=574789 RepID=A0A6A6YJJ7_9PEZI|nr:MFS general substrate transporter [Mytilinidion resinicola]KAF2808981.1 MFS general substrate transporter [Mytilinidion resinicola]
MDVEKEHSEVIEHVNNSNELQREDTIAAHGFAVESEELPAGYWRSPYFIGTFLAIGMNLAVSDSSIIWLSLVYTIGLAVGLLLVGRLSDIFGRRWFFIGGTMLGLIGAIIASTAKTIPVLIGGQTLVGLSACTGYSYSFISGEIVPVRHRFIANAIIFIFSMPTAGFGAAISTSFITKTGPGWSLYPWKDPKTISFIVVGFLCLVALFLYETLVDLKEPLIPMHIFRTKGFTPAMLSLSLGASVYYSQAIIWPQMAATVYGNGRTSWVGIVSCLVGIGITTGEVIGGTLGGEFTDVDRKYQCITVISLGTLLLGLMAVCTPDTPNAAMGIVFIATIFVGWNESLVLPICTIVITDQQEIGTAAGIAGSSRSAISTVASTIYSVVLATRVGETIPSQVPVAVIAAGLPATSVADYMTAIAAGGSPKLLAAVKGLTPKVLAAGSVAYKHAYMDAYRTIFLVSIAFGGLAIIASIFIPDIDKLMTRSVAATLQGRKGDEETVGEKYHRKHIEAHP